MKLPGAKYCEILVGSMIGASCGLISFPSRVSSVWHLKAIEFENVKLTSTSFPFLWSASPSSWLILHKCPPSVFCVNQTKSVWHPDSCPREKYITATWSWGVKWIIWAFEECILEGKINVVALVYQQVGCTWSTTIRQTIHPAQTFGSIIFTSILKLLRIVVNGRHDLFLFLLSLNDLNDLNFKPNYCIFCPYRQVGLQYRWRSSNICPPCPATCVFNDATFWHSSYAPVILNAEVIINQRKVIFC